MHRPSLRKLDYLPRILAIAMAIALGTLLGFALTNFDYPITIVGYLTLLSLAAWLAHSGKPITVLEREMEVPKKPKTKPKPDPDPVVSKPAITTFDPIPNPSAIDDLALENIPAGDFVREGTTISVSAFQCMKFAVTRRLYKKIMGEDPAFPEGETDTRPVNHVTWYDAIEFCNRLSESEGLNPVYDGDRENGFIWNKQADGFRLPTEAEWEYACRAGSDTNFCFGNNQEMLTEYAWFNKNSGHLSKPVGTKKPNQWQLYDMHGNVWEWCWDWYGEYSDKALQDPEGPETGEYRVLRGGAFFNSADFLRSAFRYWDWPEVVYRNVGFRCVRASRRQP